MHQCCGYAAIAYCNIVKTQNYTSRLNIVLNSVSCNILCTIDGGRYLKVVRHGPCDYPSIMRAKGAIFFKLFFTLAWR